MALSPAQKLTLKNFVEADGTLNAIAHTRDGAQLISDALDALASPDFYVWKTAVPPEAYKEVIVWTEVDTLSAGRARIWEWMTDYQTQTINPSLDNIRQGIQDVFTGTTTLTALVVLGKRKASRLEKLFATGTGSQGTPAKLVIEGSIGADEVFYAMGWNNG